MIGVCIVTYNQEQYIAQAIESVLMQDDCGHRVIAYIGNDCSSDKTGEICHQYVAQYPEAIKVIDNPRNLGLVGNTMSLLEFMRKDGCNYIAMLDGDDYWSDSKKLQKQMAYMDAHPEYGLVHTYVDDLYPSGIRVDKRKKVQEGNVWPCIWEYTIGNCSVMFRTELLNLIDFEDFQSQGLRSCDYSMYIIFASKWQFGFIPDHTAVWRRGIESVSGSADMERQIAYVQNDLAHWKYIAKLFPERWSYSAQEGENYFHTCAFNIAFRYGDRARALQEASLMPLSARRKNRFKIFCAETLLLMWFWNILKK